MTASGHEDQFPLPTLNAGCRFGQGTHAGMGGKEEDAPMNEPALAGSRASRSVGFWRWW
jgi:hypothetical protein